MDRAIVIQNRPYCIAHQV